MNHIGVDCHSRTFVFAVANERGDITHRHETTTSATNFFTFVRSVNKPRSIYIEEGELAGWLSELCEQHQERLVVADPKQNQWINQSDKKDDHIDAAKLAQLARGGYIKPIYHPTGARRRMKELVQAYHDTIGSQTRLKNKIKAKFRQNGVQCSGATVYSPDHRGDWRSKLPDEPVVHLLIDQLWDRLDMVGDTLKRIRSMLKELSRPHSQVKQFQDLPGIGFIHAVTLFALLDTPHRFPTKKHVWSYAGLGIVERSSGSSLSIKQLGRDYNRLLKGTIKQAAQAAIRSKDNPFRQQFIDLTVIKNKPGHLAILTVARSMMATVWAMWKNDTTYDPSRRNVKHNS